MRAICIRLLPSFSIVALASLASWAQLPTAKLSWVFPPGTATGTTQEVAVAGADLDEPVGLVFSDSRIRAVPRADGSPVFEVSVPSEVRPGLVDVRFRGRFGISNPRGFQISNDPERLTAPNHTSPATALDLPLDTVLNSRVMPANHYWFRFPARRGQRILVSIQARELDSRLVPDLAVYTENRTELRVARRSQLLDFTAPDTGTFLLRLNDQTFKGGDEYVYRLTLSTRPRVDFAFPLALTENSNQTVTVFGRNLPDGKVSTLQGADGQFLETAEWTLALPNDASEPIPLHPWVVRRPAGANGAPEHVAWSPRFHGWTHPAVLFAHTSLPSRWSLSNECVRTTIPVDFSGAFPRRGEKSGVVFDAKKDSVYWIEVFSDRLGFNTDPHLVVQRVRTDEKGAEKTQDLAEYADLDANLGGREFDTTSRDAAGRFQIPEDGTYRVVVRDLIRSSPTSPRMPYRLQIRAESPDFRLAVFPQPPPRRDDNDRQIHLWTPNLRRGATLPLRVIAFRRDGFDGPIELMTRGLPAGVVAGPSRIAPGQNATTLLLSADPDAPTGYGAAIVSGRARIQEREVVRDAVPASSRWHVQDWDQERGNPRFAESLRFGVIAAESAPVALLPATSQPPVDVPVKGKLRLPVTIVRQADFQGAFKIKPFGHPSLEKAKEIDVPEKATQVVVEIDLGEAVLPEGEHFIHLEATASGRYRNNPEAAQAAEALAKTADTEASEAESQAKKLEETLAAARKAEDAAVAALKAAQDRSSTGSDPAAVEARNHAEKRVEELRTARIEHEKRLSDAQSQAKAAEERKNTTAARAKTATEKAQPKDVTLRIYSAPVTVRVTPPPKAG